MTAARIVVRVQDRPDALERVSGLLRRRGFAVARVSCSFVGDNAIELVISLDGTKTDPERVRRELTTLRDVSAVAARSGLDETREFLLARLRAGDRTPYPLPRGRDGVFELIGSPSEIDAVLEWLQAQDAIAGFVRSGEVAVPREHSPPQRQGET